MNVLEMIKNDASKDGALFATEPTEPIAFPIRTGNPKHDEFFEVLKKTREVKYSWKFGVLVVKGCEPLPNTDFAFCLERFIPNVENLIRILAVSQITCRITEWKGIISEAEVKSMEGMIALTRKCLPAPEKNFLSETEKSAGFDYLDKEYLNEKTKKMKPIAFPVNAEKTEHAEFFRVLEKMEKKRVTYDWGSGKLLVNKTSLDPTYEISHENFARAVSRTINTPAEMLKLLSLSEISFAVTYWWDFLTEKQMEMNEFLGCPTTVHPAVKA